MRLKNIFMICIFILLLIPITYAKDIKDDLGKDDKLKIEKQIKIKDYFKKILDVKDTKFIKEYYTSKYVSIYIFELTTETKSYTWITTQNNYNVITQ